VKRRTATKAEIAQVEDDAKVMSASDEGLLQNYRAWLYHNHGIGLYGNRRDNPCRIGRRKWIESYVVIKDKKRDEHLIALNQSQRNKEAIILRQEKAGLPVRVVTLKVRQNGDSTQTLAIAFEYMLRNTNVKVRLIADKEQLTEELLDRAQLMFRSLRDPNGRPWNLKTRKDNRDRISVDAPIYSQIYVISAKVPDPGHGETPDMLSMEETARWPDADRKAKGVEMGLPEVAGSMAFDTSTAHGNNGYYRDKFIRAWDRTHGDLSESDASFLGEGGWKPHFIPWFLHHEYRWSWIFNEPLPDETAALIMGSLDDEEKILLKQRYFTRKVGWRTVDADQLAWRRYYISEKLNGSLDNFHEQCPAFPHEAFLASGRPAFDHSMVKRVQAAYMRDPLWKGSILADESEDGAPFVFTSEIKGPLHIYEHPEPGLFYAIGVDTSAGSLNGDPQTFVVTELETRRVVADFRGWPSPEGFGAIVTMASWFYNNADVGVETHPSPHGLRVYDAALEYGCETLYSQQQFDQQTGSFSTRKGWYSTERAKIQLIGRIAVAFQEGVEIPSQRILQECLDAQLDDQDKIARNCKNDLIIAMGISLKIRDTAYREGRVPKVEPERLDFEQKWWRDREERATTAMKARGINLGHYEAKPDDKASVFEGV